MKFNRNYKLTISIGGQVLTIQPPLRVDFSGTRSVGQMANTFNVAIFNLSPENYKQLTKDPDTRKNQFENNEYTFRFEAGYGDDLGLIFAGQVFEAKTRRDGVDFITEISSIAGLYDEMYASTFQTIDNRDVAEFLIGEMKSDKGTVVDLPKLKRPRVLVGNPLKILRTTHSDKQVFIDNDKVHIIDKVDTTTPFIPVISAETGLISTPTRNVQQVNFDTVLNSQIALGGRVNIQSSTAEYLNGIYRVETIEYRGSNYGGDWLQAVTCFDYS
jgi:hypothetical protein